MCYHVLYDLRCRSVNVTAGYRAGNNYAFPILRGSFPTGARTLHNHAFGLKLNAHQGPLSIPITADSNLEAMWYTSSEAHLMWRFQVTRLHQVNFLHHDHDGPEITSMNVNGTPHLRFRSESPMTIGESGMSGITYTRCAGPGGRHPAMIFTQPSP